VGLIIFTAFVFIPQVSLVYEESSLDFFVNDSFEMEEKPSKVKLGSQDYCERLTKLYGLSGDANYNEEQLYIIVAYRDREEHKVAFMNEMNEYLKKKVIVVKVFNKSIYISLNLFLKNLNFRIILVEQNGKDPFNRAKLMNIGALEALRESFHLGNYLPIPF